MAKTEPTTVHLTICTYGDLKLSLQTSTINATYLVSSHLLCCASPVFRASLGPSLGFTNVTNHHRLKAAAISTSDDSLYEMRIGEEVDFDPTAMAVVLYVIHGRSSGIPEIITFENLLAIATICDYYDCAAAMSPWDKAWIQPLEKLALEPGYEDWLLVAYVFGKKELFVQLTKVVARNGVTMEDGKFGVKVGGEIKKMHSHLPERIIRDLAAKRAQAGEDILCVCRQIYNTYCDKSTVKCLNGQKYCDYIVFAALHLELAELGLFEHSGTYNKYRGYHAGRTLDSVVLDFTTALKSIHKNLEDIKIGGRYHPNCMRSPEEKLRKFESCLNSIPGLHLWSYSNYCAPVREATWNDVSQANSQLKNSTLIGSRWKDDFHHEICMYGDMLINLNTSSTATNVTFLVSSHALRTASQVFRDLLGPTSEFAQNTQRLIKLSTPPNIGHNTGGLYKYVLDKDYDATAFAVVLYALHGKGYKIPECFQFPHLLELAKVSEYFERSPTILPWCQIWIDKWRTTIEEPNYEEWLYIAWVFGHNDMFETLTRKLVRGSMPGASEADEIPGDGVQKKKSGQYIPERVNDAITAQKDKARQKMTEVCRYVYKKFCNPVTIECRVSSRLCDRLVFAELHWGFQNMGFLKSEDIEIPTSIPLVKSARDITKLLDDTAVNVDDARVGAQKHGGCAVALRDFRGMVQGAFDVIEPLDLAEFGQEESDQSRVSWWQILPGIMGWEDEAVGDVDLLDIEDDTVW